MTVSYIETENALTVVIAETGKIYNIDNTHPNWDKARQNLYAGEYEGLEELLSVKKTVETFFSQSTVGSVEIDDTGVKLNGEYVNNYLTNKILDFAKRGLPTAPLVKFFEKVMKNPSYRAVNELYKFLEHGLMPITPDGNFLGYKSVRPDYMDWYSNTFRNQVGDAPERKQRNQVCDDPDVGCSEGYHVGTLEYAKDFHYPSNRVVIVEVDPSDVVSVPHDCQHQKLRTMFYKVVGEFEKPLDNDFTDQYNKYTDERTVEDVENEIQDVRCRLHHSNKVMSSEDLMDIVQELKDLEGELAELEFDKFIKENATTSSTNEPCRDSKGRFCKKSN